MLSTMSEPAARLNAALEGRSAPERFIVVTNFFEELRERVGN